jgi:hypothetical protein
VFFILNNYTQRVNSYNNLNFYEVKKVVLNNFELKSELRYLFFKELKKEYFYLPEHPDLIKIDSVIVFTKDRKYKFYIQISTNQGVIVSRIDENGNSLGMNRNDFLLNIIKKANHNYDNPAPAPQSVLNKK